MTKEKLIQADELYEKLTEAQRLRDLAGRLGEGMEEEIVGCLKKANPEKAKSLHDRIKEEVISELNKVVKNIEYEIAHL